MTRSRRSSGSTGRTPRDRPRSIEQILASAPPAAPPSYDEIGTPVIGDVEMPEMEPPRADPAPTRAPPPVEQLGDNKFTEQIAAVRHLVEYLAATGHAPMHVAIGDVAISLAPRGAPSVVTGIGQPAEPFDPYKQFGGPVYEHVMARLRDARKRDGDPS